MIRVVSFSVDTGVVSVAKKVVIGIFQGLLDDELLDVLFLIVKQRSGTVGRGLRLFSVFIVGLCGLFEKVAIVFEIIFVGTICIGIVL